MENGTWRELDFGLGALLLGGVCYADHAGARDLINSGRRLVILCRAESEFKRQQSKGVR